MAFAYPAIYDFALLPYALGDILTFNVKSAIQAINAGFSKVDVYICADPESPAFVYQQGQIHAGNFELHLSELLPAFYTHPLIRNVFIFHDRGTMLEQLYGVSNANPLLSDVVARYVENTAKILTPSGAYSVLQEACSSHGDINAYFSQHGSVPQLRTPLGADADVRKYREFLGADRFLVTVQFRLRQLDSVVGTSEPDRNGDYLCWRTFFERAALEFPEAQFVMVGRTREKPLSVLRMPNVIAPRALGMTLAHDLGLAASSDLFLGTCSGFAPMAVFSSTPYALYRLGPGAYANYGIPEGSSRLPFGTHCQRLGGAESVDSLLSTLEGLIKPWRESGDRAPRPRVLRLDVVNDPESELRASATTSHRFFLNAEREDAELTVLLAGELATVLEKVSADQVRDAHRQLWRLHQRYPNVTVRMRQYHFVWSKILAQLGQWIAANEAIHRELVLAPNDVEVKSWIQTIKPRVDVAQANRDAIRVGEQLFATGAFEKAAEIFRRVLTRDPDSIDAWNNYGVTLNVLGNPVAAREAFTKAVHILPTSSDAHLNLARLAWTQGDRSGALEILRTLQVEFPEHAECNALLRELQSSQNA